MQFLKQESQLYSEFEFTICLLWLKLLFTLHQLQPLLQQTEQESTSN